MTPYVSIVYLTKNGGQLLKQSLESVFLQKVDFPYEVIAVDSGSTDGSLSTLKQFFPVRVYHVAPESFNFGLTRDYGFSLANGDIVVAISQDAVPVGEDWLNNLVSPFSDDSVAVVQGMDVLPTDVEVFYWDQIGLFYHTRDCKKWMEAYDNIGISFTCCAIRRVVWEEIPLGRVEMSEDKLFQKRARERGHKIYFQREAKDYHSHMYSVGSLSKRCENEGMGWHCVGITYTFFDMIRDIFKPFVITNLVKGLCTRRIKHLSEAVFPFIRPVFIYKGNKITRYYVK